MKKRLTLISILCFASCALAQTQAPPTPPVTGTLDTSDAATPRYEDNVRPLGGVQTFDLGNRTELFNLLTPAFDFSESYGTNPGFRTGPNGDTVWGSLTNIGGSLQLSRTNTTQQFTLGYRGGAQINSSDSSLNTQIHALSVAESIDAGRWHLVLGDDLAYEPNAFGASAPLFFSGAGSGPGSGVRPGVGPDPTIFTEQNQRLTNTTVGQVSYGLSRASLLTANVSYGILNYMDNGFLDARQLNVGGDYNHRFGRTTIGVGYTFSRFMYSAVDENFNTQSLEFQYGRRIIGRWALELAAGPTFTITNVGADSKVDMTPNARAQLHFTGNRGSVGFGYTRAVTAGSGITAGAITDSINASFQRKLGHTVTADVSTGYARNSANSSSATTFNSVFVTATVNRDVGRYLSISMGYSGQKQITDLSVGNFSSHVAIVGLHWRLRPVRLQ